jgi:hypothetical protein
MMAPPSARARAKIAKAARGLDNCIIDGKICAAVKDGLTDFAALQAAMKVDKTDKLILFAFDLLFHDGEDLRSEQYELHTQTTKRWGGVLSAPPPERPTAVGRTSTGLLDR